MFSLPTTPCGRSRIIGLWRNSQRLSSPQPTNLLLTRIRLLINERVSSYSVVSGRAVSLLVGTFVACLTVATHLVDSLRRLKDLSKSKAVAELFSDETEYTVIALSASDNLIYIRESEEEPLPYLLSALHCRFSLYRFFLTCCFFVFSFFYLGCQPPSPFLHHNHRDETTIVKSFDIILDFTLHWIIS